MISDRGSERQTRPRLVFVTGDFSSGSTLLFNLFRASDAFHCLYEPLHEYLLEYLVWPLQVNPHHPNTVDYFGGFRGFRRIPRLFDPTWATKRLYMDRALPVPRLRRYLEYLVDTSLERRCAVMLKFNRMCFRLGWLKHRFPEARIIHVRRDMDSQWQSLVRRAQENHGREDVGQDSVHFSSFRMGLNCDELAGQFPELAAEANSSGYERFCRYWKLSDREQSKFADLTVTLESLRSDLATPLGEISRCVGARFDATAMKRLLSANPTPEAPGPVRWWRQSVHRMGRAYAKYYVRARQVVLRRLPDA